MVNYLTLFIAGLVVAVESRTIDSSNLIEALKTSGKLQESKGESTTGLSEYKNTDDRSTLISVDQDSMDRTLNLSPQDLSRFSTSQGFNIEKLLTEFTAKFANVKDYEDKAAQWLKQLKMMLMLLSNDYQPEKSKHNDNQLNDVEEMRTTLPPRNRKIISTVGDNWLDDLLEYFDEQDIEAQSTEDNNSHVKSRYEDDSTSFFLSNENREEDDDEKSHRYTAEELDSMLVGVVNDLGNIRRYFDKLCRKHHAMSVHSKSHNIERHSNSVHEKKV